MKNLKLQELKCQAQGALNSECFSVCIKMLLLLSPHNDLGKEKSNFVATADPLNTLGLSFGQFFRGIKGCIMSS